MSPWTHPFDGPSGSLVTVITAPRKTLLHTTSGLVGVTASTGTYGFLELPDDAALSPGVDDQFALSPDGRRLAFWGSSTRVPTTGSHSSVRWARLPRVSAQ